MSKKTEAEHEITRRVREFYEQFQFPGRRPWDRDGLILMRRIGNFVTAGTASIRLLDAGCGTGNTAISLARTFPTVQVLGLDISEPSLSIARESSRGMKNLDLKIWDLMDRMGNIEPFDVVLCLGVLHHTADMNRVLANLQEVLKEKGELYLWVYGRHGRYRHSLNQRLLALLLGADTNTSAGLRRAMEFASGAGSGSVFTDLTGQWCDEIGYRRLLQQPAWIADQFLHPHENLLDMEELLPLISRAGLRLEKWLGIPAEVKGLLGSVELEERFASLGAQQRLLAIDLLLKPDHYFLILRK
jgi:SAM-dependent methyltransferase